MSAFIKLMKKDPALIPLFAVIGGGVAMAGLYTLRLATKSYDVVWDRRNPYPWNSVPQTANAHFFRVQTKPHDEVFKPQAADDLRGRL
eukprot:m.405116 g.405116  ORF g.405116 m.405116 type:complete len:88 (+) comp56485_c0_seq9:165-428(+)